MDWSNISLLIIAGSQIGLSFLVLLRNYKNKINFLFFLSIFSLSIWVLSTALFRSAATYWPAYHLYQLKLISGLFLPMIFQAFTIFFPYQRVKINYLGQSILFIIFLILSLIIVFEPSWVIQALIIVPGNNSIIINKCFWIFYAFTFTLGFILAFSRLYGSFLKQDGFLRVSLGFIIFSAIIPAIICWFFNIMFLFFDYFVNDWLGAFLTIIFSFVLSYFILFENKRIYIK